MIFLYLYIFFTDILQLKVNQDSHSSSPKNKTNLIVESNKFLSERTLSLNNY